MFFLIALLPPTRSLPGACACESEGRSARRAPKAISARVILSGNRAIAGADPKERVSEALADDRRLQDRFQGRNRRSPGGEMDFSRSESD
jgi:hypothetical protein